MKKKKRKSKRKKTPRVPSLRLKALSPRQRKTKLDPMMKRPPSRFSGERLNRAIAKLLNEHELKNKNEADRYLQQFVIGKNLDEILSLREYDPIEEAQSLAYKAMDSDDPLEAMKLARDALLLDPNCIDALMLVAKYTSRSLPETIEKVKQIIAKSEQAMRKEFLEENKGHFWGVIETRPYMRARAFLVEALQAVGQIGEAIRHCGEMLELNPNDNQGMRDILLGMYLETGNLEGARKLFKQYPESLFAVFLWGHVLERFLSGDIRAAAKAFNNANKRNPYAVDYLTGKKRPPPQPLQYYSPGDVSEAIVCFDTIGPAWQKHPEAIEWLKSLM